jgi:hypothetical protein
VSLRSSLAKVQGQTPAKGGSLRQTATTVLRPDGRGAEALKVAEAASLPVQVDRYLGFLVDATASRAATWGEAQRIQANMFQAVEGINKLHLGLAHYGGEELVVHEWRQNAQALAARMETVSCKAGYTQILSGLQAFLNCQDRARRANSIILTGDAFEEGFAELETTAAALAIAGIRCFCFLEGHNERAARAFRTLAEKTGGAFVPFGEAMPLNDLCEGAALLTAGGASALERLKNGAARKALMGKLQLT